MKKSRHKSTVITLKAFEEAKGDYENNTHLTF